MRIPQGFALALGDTCLLVALVRDVSDTCEGGLGAGGAAAGPFARGNHFRQRDPPRTWGMSGPVGVLHS